MTSLTTAPSPVPCLPLNASRAFATWPPFTPGVLDYNATVICLEDGARWALFCRDAAPVPGHAAIWAVRVDAALRPVGEPLPLIAHGMDPRAVTLGGRVLVFFTRVEHDAHGVIRGAVVAVAEFSVSVDRWTEVAAYALPKQPISGHHAAACHPAWEKNWVPFASGTTQVALIYAHDPWDVVLLDLPAGAPPRLAGLYRHDPLRWARGVIRGGTPPVPFDEDHLVTFFHAAQIVGSRRVYSVGACVFQARAPYAPRALTGAPLLLAPYHTGAERFGWPLSASVIFPLGCVREADGYRLLCGRDDGEVAVFAVSHRELADRLDTAPGGHPGALHDYTEAPGAELPPQRLLYVPHPIPGIPELPMVQFLDVLAQHAPPSRRRSFVDVGAHIGFYTMGLAARFSRVVAFEPSRLQYGWLRRNAALNGYPHVTCENVALGAASGHAMLSVLSREGGLNSLSPEVAARHAALERYEVPVAPLDAYRLDDVDLLKIDVEGFEAEVLRGAAATIAAGRPMIMMEVWPDQTRRAAMAAQLADLGYAMEFVFPRAPELALCLPLERRGDYRWFV